MTHQAQSRRHRTLVGGTLLSAAALFGAIMPAAAQSPTEIDYAIWGDASELASQQAMVDGFNSQHPDIKVNVIVSDWETYWDKLQTGLAGGDAPDVFAMDGPLYPDYQSRDVLLDLTPYIERDAFDLTALADAGVAHFTTPEGQFGLPRDLNVVGLYYNKAMFDAAGIAYPDDTWTWDTLVDVGKQLTLDKDGDGQTDQWGFYTETTDMENYWSELVWQNGGDIVSADRTKTLLGSDEAIGGIQQLQDLIYTHKIMPPATGDGHPRRRVRAGSGGDGGERLLAGPDAPCRGHRPGHRTAAGRPGARRDEHQPDGRGGGQVHAGARCGLGVREVPRRPRRPDAADAAQGGRAGRQERPRRWLQHRIPGQRRVRGHRSRMPCSSLRSEAIASGPRPSRRSWT